MNTTIRTPLAALALLLPLSAAMIAPSALAQPQAVVASAAVQALTLEASAGLGPGSLLRVQVQAVAGSRNASVTLGDHGPRIALQEQGAGRYVGAHVVTPLDRIDARERITVHMDWNGRPVTRSFDFPRLADAGGRPPPPPQAGHPVPPRPPAQQVQAAIERFDVKAPSRIAAGSTLRFELRGTPGAQVAVDIPGAVRSLKLTERSRGLYEGSYTIRQREDLRAFDEAVATLQRGKERSTARASLRDLRDQRPPEVTQVSPGQGDRVHGGRQEQVSARFQDSGSGIDLNSVRLKVDGRDVTRQARVSADGVVWRGDLARGRHSAQLEVRDRAGNLARRSWSFQLL